MTISPFVYWFFTASFGVLLAAFGALLVEYLHVRSLRQKWEERSDEWHTAAYRWEMQFKHLDDTHGRLVKELQDKRKVCDRYEAMVMGLASDIEAFRNNPSLEEGGF